MFRPRRVDTAQPDIVTTLEAVGATVEIIPGRKGRPDLLVGFRGRNFLLEVKTPGREKTHKAHLQRQDNWRAHWQGDPGKVVRTPQEALEAIGASDGRSC